MLKFKCVSFFFLCLQSECKVVTPQVYGTGSVFEVIIFKMHQAVV